MELKDIQKRYKVPQLYKDKQLTPNKLPVPFEKLDFTIYKETANCISFVTNVARMHFWVHALSQRLCGIETRDKELRTHWIDYPKDQAFPDKTEFQVSKVKAEGEPDIPLYKVIVYLTTGKIMIQGKSFKKWCDEEFDNSMKIVKELVEKLQRKKEKVIDMHVTDPNTSKSQTQSEGEESSKESENVNSNKEQLTLEAQVQLKRNEPRDKPKIGAAERSCSTQHSEEQTAIHEEKDDSDIDIHTSLSTLNSRTTMIENSVLKFADHVLETHTTLQSIDSRLDQNVQDIKCIMNFIKSLKNRDDPMEEAHKRELKALNDRLREIQTERSEERKELHSTITKLEREIQIRKDTYSAESNKLKDKLEDEYARNQELQGKIEVERSQVRELKSKLEDKQKTIVSLQDQIRSIEYDIDGESWEHVSRNKLTKYAQTENVVGSSPNPDTIISQPNAMSPEVINLESDDEISIETDIILMHDSVCKHINMNRLVAGTIKSGTSLKAPTVSEADETVRMLTNKHERIVLHTGINDLRNDKTTVPELFTNFKQLVENALKKAEKVVIALPLPCEEQPLQSYVVAFNSLLISEFSHSPRVIICRNDNFTTNDTVIKRLYQDDIHVNGGQGTRLLAGNLKRALFGTPVRNELPIPREPPRGHFNPQFKPRQLNGFSHRSNFPNVPSLPKQAVMNRELEYRFQRNRPLGNRQQNMVETLSAALLNILNP